ncbi:hypothetical protein [Paenibacillus silvisoli]|uniref:hypothetical protein n=1 Tax=Paenibacillus silvisoli TaxID=3110539 RepID=UPI0028046953|nr:hypothetical protein [Paenibacillus silvisoli]
MSKISVVYEIDGNRNQLYPVWMLLNTSCFTSSSWEKTLYISVDAPFIRHTFDEIDNHTLALSVPTEAYVLNPSKPDKFGLSLPALRRYAEQICEKQGVRLKTSFIDRLILQIVDIEEIMQMNLQTKYHWD